MSSSYENRLDDVPHFDVKITNKNLETTVQMLISHLKKSWNINQLQQKVFDSGITNKLYGYYIAHEKTSSPEFAEYGRSDIVLVRIYGNKTDLIIDRAQELRNFEELSKYDIAPPLYCTFSNGYCYKYLEGRVLGPDDFKDPKVMKLCLKQVAKMHSLNVSEAYLKHHQMESTLFKTMYRYVGLIPNVYSKVEIQKRFLDLIPSINELKTEVRLVENTVAKLKTTVAFCHNDLLCANFIFDEYNEKMFFIDYEYGCPNYTAYDVANHFNEFAGLDDVDYNLYPSKDVQMNWIQMYLNELKCIRNENTSTAAEEFYAQVQVFALASHLFWGIWALIQAHHSEIDFDYMGYSDIRLKEYFARKDEFLGIAEKYFR